jgi:group I intron endonuclease
MEKISGIYSIVHIESGRPYVGSALDIYKRWSEHKSELTYNYHDNQRLQHFWNKYGEAAFEFKILELVVDPSLLLNREQFWMDKLESYNRDKGFNIRKVAESNFGLKHTEETKERMSKSCSFNGQDHSGEKNAFFGEKHTEESKKKMKIPRSEEGKAAIKASRLAYSESIKILKICPSCNIEFKTLPCEDKKFCSKKCSSKYYGRLKTQEGTLKKNCLICNTEFTTNRFQDKKYCSRKCWAISMKGNKYQSA